MNWRASLISRDEAFEAISSKDVTQLDVVLLCLATEDSQPLTVSEIKTIGINLGARKIESWNINTILKRGSHYAAKLPRGYALTKEGQSRAMRIASSKEPQVISESLSDVAKQLTEGFPKDCLVEAGRCLEMECYRSAVIMSWIGASAALYQYVLANRLPEFNEEARKRIPKWRTATSFDDLANCKESEFLTVACASSVFGKSVKQELEACLTFRNGCGHPNTLIVNGLRARAHIETLINNVYLKYAIS